MATNNNQISFIQFPSIFNLIGYALASFLIVQVLGILGIFISFAYPLWWFFIPQRTFCFFCLHTALTRPNGLCPVCKRTVTTIYDPPFKAVLPNMLTIFILSILSAGIVFIEINLFTDPAHFVNSLPIPMLHRQEAQFLFPDKNTFSYGNDFEYDIVLNNRSQPVNVIRADIQFDKNLLEISAIKTDKSFANIFAQKDYSNVEGWIHLVAGLPNPGFIGDHGIVATIVFHPKIQGAGTIHYLDTSKVLANDGKGTNILYKFASSPIVIQ